MARKIEGFPAVYDDRARVLILGSMPSVTSLDRTQYYGHPQNHFWPIMGRIFGAGLELEYEQRLRILVRHRVALWDVAHRCHREQSADATMRGVEPNAIPALVEKCRQLRAIFLNGRKAEDLFRRLVLPDLGERGPALVVRYLPSTSPANAGMKLSDKLRAWRIVSKYTGDRDGG